MAPLFMINFLELLIHNNANLRHILVNQKKGLSAIPEYIAASLDFNILDKLSLNGHGLSFPSHGVIQFRFIYEGQNIGRTYRIDEFNSVNDAIKTAMKHHVRLTNDLPRLYKSKKGCVSFIIKHDKRNGKNEHIYSVSYKKECGKPAIKSFSMGYSFPSPDKQLHAFRTAKIFRYLWEDGVSDLAFFSKWRHQRLYFTDYEYFDWEKA